MYCNLYENAKLVCVPLVDCSLYNCTYYFYAGCLIEIVQNCPTLGRE